MEFADQPLVAEVRFGGARIEASVTLRNVMDWFHGVQLTAAGMRKKDSYVEILLACPDCGAGPVYLSTRRIRGVLQQCCNRCDGRFVVEGL